MFQAAVYSVWKERNSRLLNWIIRALDSTVKEVHLQLRSKLFALDREDDHTFPHSSHHHTTPTSSQSTTYVSHLLIKQCIFNCISQKQYPDFLKKEKKKKRQKNYVSDCHEKVWTQYIDKFFLFIAKQTQVRPQRSTISFHHPVYS